LCKLSPIQDQSLEAWFEDFNRDKGIIFEAVKIAADRNRKNFGMVELLFREWANNNLTNVEQIQSYERNKYDKQRQQTRPYVRTGAKVERVPEWLNHQQKQQQQVEPNENNITEADREKLLAKLENLRRQNA